MSANPAPGADLQLSTQNNPNEVIVRGTGKINAASSATLQQAIRDLIPQNKKIVLDLSSVDYIDSSGLGALVSVYMAANRAKVDLELANPKPRVRELFKLTKLADVFQGGGENYFGGL
jgi:anti-sigma B factor antagonist